MGRKAAKRSRNSLPGGLRNRNGKIYYYFWKNGRQITGSTGLPVNVESIPEALRLREAARASARTGPSDRRLRSFGELVREAIKLQDVKDSTRVLYQRASKNFVQFFGDSREVTTITPADIERWKHWRRESGIAATTIRNGLVLLSMIFKHAVRDRVIPANPVDGISKPPEVHRQRVVTPEEESAYFAAAWKLYPGLAAFATLMIEQGVRPMEILRMTPERVVNGVYWISESKTPAGCRWLYLTPRSLEALRRITPVNTADLYFQPGPGSKSLLWPPWARTQQHEKVLEALGSDRWPLYTLRHTFATRAMQRGVHPLVLAKIMGHASPVITEIYQHASEDDVRNAMEQLSSGHRNDTKDRDKPGYTGTSRDIAGFRRIS